MFKSILFILFLAQSALAAQFSHPERKFSFEYDESRWEIVPEKTLKTPPKEEVDRAMAEKTLVTLQRKQADDKYRARFSVVADDLKKFKGSRVEQTLAYQKHAIDFLKGQRFHVLSTVERKLPGITETAFEITANQRDFGLTFRQVIFLKGNEAYLLTAATRTGKFDEYDKETRKFFETFRFNP